MTANVQATLKLANICGSAKGNSRYQNFCHLEE